MTFARPIGATGAHRVKLLIVSHAIGKTRQFASSAMLVII